MYREFYFILVEPAVPGNMGSAARAIKTMGFQKMRLVNPADHLADEARWMAHGSNDILEQAEVFSNFEDAVKDLDLVIGTTAKKRTVSTEYFHSNDLPEMIKAKGETVKKIGIVFGREKSGLHNEELQHCHIASSVPLASPYPSINLAQSVMVYAYTLSPFVVNQTIVEQSEEEEVNPAGFGVMQRRVTEVLEDTSLMVKENLYKRILERLGNLKEADVKLVLSICTALLEEKKK
ncbi:MAG: tRNA/rRNA methyltransferase [Bacteroidales bacterium]|nr:tRNA/rRNA methyltransferase [Bacteroidales bacterium]